MHARHVRQEANKNLLNYRSVECNNGNLERTYWDNEENLAFKETLFTSDQSTLVTNDEQDDGDFNDDDEC